ncbi:MAG: tyrosine-type recombinase/integrase [Candidatus Caldarchaeum sp.]
MKSDVHGYTKKLTNLKERVNSASVDASTRRYLLRFEQHCALKGISIARREKCLSTLLQVYKFLGKPLAKANKRDIIKFIEHLQQSSLSEWTKRDYKVILKIFYRFIRGMEGSGRYPPEVEWIPTREPNGRALPSDQLLTPEEVQALAQSAHNARDRAAVLVLYESGCRVGEFLSLRIRDVRIDEYGAVLMVDGKTGRRRVRVIASASALANWLIVHPYKDNPDAPLWVALASNFKGKALNYRGFCEMLKELARRAKIRKRVNPHSFRHARATHLANKLTEAQMKELFGWTQSSDMASIYVHLSGRDVDNALLEIHGLSPPSKSEEKFRLKVCPRCQEKNSPDAVYCARCALPLDVRTTAWEDRVLNELLKRPQVNRILKKALMEMARKAEML